MQLKKCENNNNDKINFNNTKNPAKHKNNFKTY